MTCPATGGEHNWLKGRHSKCFECNAWKEDWLTTQLAEAQAACAVMREALTALDCAEDPEEWSIQEQVQAALAPSPGRELVGELARLRLTLSDADVLVGVIDEQIQKGFLGSRTPIADARLNYGEPGALSAELARLREENATARALLEEWAETFAIVQNEPLRARTRAFLGEGGER